MTIPEAIKQKYPSIRALKKSYSVTITDLIKMLVEGDSHLELASPNPHAAVHRNDGLVGTFLSKPLLVPLWSRQRFARVLTKQAFPRACKVEQTYEYGSGVDIVTSYTTTEEVIEDLPWLKRWLWMPPRVAVPGQLGGFLGIVIRSGYKGEVEGHTGVMSNLIRARQCGLELRDAIALVEKTYEVRLIAGVPIPNDWVMPQAPRDGLEPHYTIERGDDGLFWWDPSWPSPKSPKVAKFYGEMEGRNVIIEPDPVELPRDFYNNKLRAYIYHQLGFLLG